MDNAAQIFENLTKKGKTELDILVAKNAEEHTFLDFKRKNDNDGYTPLHKDDRSNLAKALSGFSNSQGGIVIWGMEKNKGKLLSYSFIKSPKTFLESLNQATAEVVIPFVEGVQHKILYEANNEGIVATYIPESEKTPHTTNIGGGVKYYTRSGDSFRQMEHFQIEDMFGRRSRPKLTLKLKAEKYGEQHPTPTYHLLIELCNQGKAISQHYGFDLDFPTKTLTENERISLRPGCSNDTGALIKGFGVIKYRNLHDKDQRPIYPNETISICPNNYKLGHIPFCVTISQQIEWNNYALRYIIYSENMYPQVGEIKFNDLFDD